MRLTTNRHHNLAPVTSFCGIFAWILIQAAGCATPEHVPNAMAEAPPPRTVSYQLQIEPRMATVEATFRRPAADPLPLKLTAPATQNRVYRIKARLTSTGQPLIVASDPAISGRWLVAGAGTQDITVNYLIIDQRETLAENASDGPIPPLTTSRTFYGQGLHLFLLPDLPKTAPPLEGFKVSVDAIPDDWAVWTSWGRTSTGLDRSEALLGSLILAGDWQVSQRKGSKTLIQIATPADYPLEPAPLKATTDKIARYHGAIFGSYPWNALLLVFAPGAPQARTWTASGAITTLTPSGTKLDEAAAARLLSGAHFQLWTRSLTTALNTSQNPDTQWFSLGVPHYYALRTLTKMKIIDQDAFVAQINAWTNAYYDLALADGERTPDEQRHMRDLKGRLFAFIVDVNLRAESLGLRTLDHLMQKMFLDFGQTGTPYTNTTIIEHLNQLSKQSWSAFFETQLSEDMKPLPLDSLDRGGVIVSTTRRELGFQLGFTTLEKKLKNATVTSVQEGSAASEAGLKVGDIIQGIAYKADDPKTPVHIVIRRSDSDAPINMTYQPVEVVLVPHVQEIGPLLWEWIGP